MADRLQTTQSGGTAWTQAAIDRAVNAYDDLLCPECAGEGKVNRFLEPETLSGIAAVECPVCMGSGVPYPELVVRTILEAAGRPDA